MLITGKPLSTLHTLTPSDVARLTLGHPPAQEAHMAFLGLFGVTNQEKNLRIEYTNYFCYAEPC